MLRFTHGFAIFLLFFSSVLTVDAFAQEQEVSASSSAITRSKDGTTTIYPARYFTPYNPFSLNDMLQRIPGVAISQSVAEEERRGLRGNEDAILINGQQVTGKDSGGASALQRIAASQVDRIEIIRGSSSEVQSTTKRIINIILLEGSGDTFTFTFALPNYTGDGSARPGMSLTYGVSDVRRNYSIAFQALPKYRPWERIKETFDLSGLPILNSIETEQADNYSANLTGRYEQLFPAGSRLQLNGLLQWNNNDLERREVLRQPMLPLDLNKLSDVLEVDERDRYTMELSVDYSRLLGAAATFTILGVYNWQEENKQRSLFDIEPLDELILTAEDRFDTNTESILRGTFDKEFTQSLGFQLGLEGTINTQKTEFSLLQRLDGILQQSPIFNSDGKVTEYRGEGFSALRWRPATNIETEFGMAIEVSQITQKSADIDNARYLVFAKPTFSMFWDITRRNKLLFKFQRDVAQLDFSFFVANIGQTEQELEAGNPDLNPVRSWDYELGLEHSLADGAGVITGTLFYRDVQDVRGRVTFDGLVSQISNIGAGIEYGLDSEVSLDFSRLGLWDGVLTANYLRRHTSVVDPFESISRRFGYTPNWDASVQYRQEIKTLIDGFISFDYKQTGDRFINDIDKRDRLFTEGSLTVTIEHKLNNRFRINLASNNVLNAKETRDRMFFDSGSGGMRQVTATRKQKAKWGRIYNIFLRGTF
ncbi:MAG: TonB-dependent receptor domain-containing protein [Rhodospirillaceae bacterium]